MVNAFFSGNGLSRSRLWTWPCHAAKSGIAICVATFAHGVGLVYGLLFANCSGLSLLNFICTSFFFYCPFILFGLPLFIFSARDRQFCTFLRQTVVLSSTTLPCMPAKSGISIFLLLPQLLLDVALPHVFLVLLAKYPLPI